ncbi:MTA1 [Cordylochernes scorpioides]|uniref:MTA1 n=1 Tax=Cordylochernes scorpioides TaxID=51811 RepID=A0ABY6L2I5_9ARAC|nr:MTA1 [Cordylochernes scorpioides]
MIIMNPNGNVEAKVSCYVRRRDLTTTLIGQVNKSQMDLEEEQEEEYENLSDVQKHRFKHRELYLTRQAETLPATHIRGKCSVALLNERETLSSYLNRENPQMCVVHSSPQFVVARSVGTFARALDCSSSVKQPSLHMSAAAASRDITLFHGMDLLHQSKYNITEAISRLVPPGGPVLCRDEMEEWTPSEANLFEEAIDKYGKDFNDIRQDFLPWKSSKNIVEYYYMWKTTDRYVQQKRAKAIEAESKLKQVYIPNYGGPWQSVCSLNGADSRLCDCCKGPTYSQWYLWNQGTVQAHVCNPCWVYWKKYGGLPYICRLGTLALVYHSVSPTLKASSSLPLWFQSWNPVPPTLQCVEIRKKKSAILQVDNPKLNVADSDGLNPDKDDPDASYPCNNCNKVFNRQERLISHMASHRPHRCTIDNCNKLSGWAAQEFKLKAHLSRHCSIAHRVSLQVEPSSRPIVKTRAAFMFRASLAAKAARQLVGGLRHAGRRPFQLLGPVARPPGAPLPRAKCRPRPPIEQVSARLGIPTHLPCEEWLRLQQTSSRKVAHSRVEDWCHDQ